MPSLLYMWKSSPVPMTNLLMYILCWRGACERGYLSDPVPSEWGHVTSAGVAMNPKIVTNTVFSFLEHPG